jgi:hypothetical protein
MFCELGERVSRRRALGATEEGHGIAVFYGDIKSWREKLKEKNQNLGTRCNETSVSGEQKKSCGSHAHGRVLQIAELVVVGYLTAVVFGRLSSCLPDSTSDVSMDE